ncbi:MAG TPA: tetratricopeptide repeat protein, partial [Flavisolibacter sp.]|nr:tetratricopeptide repeat protein [Flavisolibacter sp.]
SEILNAIPNIQPINLPYQTIGNDFKGREMFMAELYRELSASTGNAAAVAVHGLGGMGKTRLAVEYAWQHQNDYTALLFINAGSAELLKTNIAALSGQRALNLPEHEGKEEDVKYSAVINWLNQYSRWLLVLDNADTKEAAKKVEEVFAQLQHGHVIITTRVDSWSRQIKKKRIDVLSRDAATSFLLETTMAEREKNSNDEELAAGIAADLGYLALALEQARAYIVTKELSFDQYRKNWDKNKTSVLSWFDAQQMQYPASVAITWQTSFSQLSHPAMALLRRLSWLAPDPIPKTLFEVEVPDTRPIDAIGAWQELKQYSLASSSEDKKAFTVHKLVQDVTRSKLNNSEASKKLGEAVNWLDAAFTGDPTNVHEWPQLEPLVPHILTLLDHTKKQETGNSFSRLINNVALLFYTKAQYKMAEPLMRRVTEIYKQSFGEDHPKVALALNNLAPLLQATNRLEEAESLMRKALKIDEQSFGENHPNVARDVNNLAQLLKNTNRLEEAAPLMRRALFIVVTTLGFDHPNTQTIGNNYVFLLQQMGKSEEEIEIILSSLS